MSKFTIHNGQIIDTRTGTMVGFNEHNNKHYAAVLQRGHCDNGHFIPVLATISAENIESAIEIAKRLGGIKQNSKNCVLAIKEISKIQESLIDSINAEDNFLVRKFNAKHPETRKRQVIMYEKIDWEGKERFKKHPDKIQPRDVKLAHHYEKYMVLQRYFAPFIQGHDKNNICFPKKVDFDKMLDEFFYYSTYNYGKRFGHSHILAFYLQLYGLDNALGVSYSDGKMKFANEGTLIVSPNNNYDKQMLESDTIELPLSEGMIPYMEKFMEEALKEKEKQQESLPEVKIPSARERFNSRFQKTQNHKNNLPIQ